MDFGSYVSGANEVFGEACTETSFLLDDTVQFLQAPFKTPRNSEPLV